MSGEEQAPPPPPQLPGTPQLSGVAVLLIIVAALCFVAAAIFTGKGIAAAYDTSYASKIVGGDAYNYIIAAGRGTTLVCAGVVFALAGVACAIFALMESQRVAKT